MALLSEIGVLPPGMREHDLDQLDVRHLVLASREGTKHMIMESVRVEDYIITKVKTDLKFSKFVVVYIDPAPTETNRSYHAMSFITRATSVDPMTGQEKYHYIILWVEEFSTSWVKRGAEDAEVLASVFMRSTMAIARMYNAYFKVFYVIPETNSISLDRFHYHCESMKSILTTLGQHNVEILTSVIKVGTKRSFEEEEEQERRHKKLRHELESRMRKGVGMEDTNMETDYADVMSLSNRGGVKLSKVNLLKKAAVLYELKGKRNEEDIRAIDSTQYRLGYRLGSDKFKRFCNFFSSCYNKSETNMSDITCAYNVASFFLTERKIAIPSYIAQKMEELSIRKKILPSGKITYSISGKAGHQKEGDTEYIQDDLAVAIVCSVSLFEEIVTCKFLGNFIRIEPHH